MKVLYLVNQLRYTCGVTNHLIHLTKGISQKGFNVLVLCGGGNGLERFQNIDVKVFGDERFLHEKRSVWNYISAIKFLRNFVLNNDINLIHSHYHYGANIARIVSKITGIPAIQTSHGLIETKGRLKHFAADRYIAINEHIMNYMIVNKIAERSDISFIRCGIPIPDNFVTKPQGKIRFLTASRLVRDKGIDIFIKAVSELDEVFIEKADFLIAGEGPEENYLRDMNRSLGNRVQFLGRIYDMYEFFSNVHVLVYPSRSRSEGFPAIITEAGATGTLVMSSRFIGHDSLLDENNSILFNQEDSYGLGNLIGNVINNYNNYEQQRRNLYITIKEKFSIREMIEKHIQLYKTITI